MNGHKYHAKAIVIDNIKFASQREGKRYQELRLRERAGEIRDLETQPVFPIFAVGLLPVPEGDEVPILPAWASLRRVAKFTADFIYTEVKTGERVVEDSKVTATMTTAYRLRKRIVEATYGISIQEV